MKKSDVLVIGAGAAGCSAALRAADLGLSVVMLSHVERPTEDSNTSWAQGGIAYRSEADSAAILAQDIQFAGAMICRDEAVALLAERGPEVVRELLIERCGVVFDRNPEGELHFTAEGAHSLARVLHVKDATGRYLSQGLLHEVQKHPNITIYYGATAIDLIMRGYHTEDAKDIYLTPQCLGVYAMFPDTRQVKAFVARETLLATGGLGQIYHHTTNPERARGDGVAMAYRVGARVIHLEYIQFHPTALYIPNTPRFLISESVRGEGGWLVNRQGNRFMKDYHELAELAPRDVVARAIHEEMLETGEDCVFLDVSHLDAGWLVERFPNIYQLCQDFGIDLREQPIPVVPAAHYSCGGIAVDLDGRTNIPGLRAIGEVSCTGVHGANRLASTSLLEAITWGVLAAESAAHEQHLHPDPTSYQVRPWELQTEAPDPALIQQDWMTIQYTMWNYVGLVRSNRRLKRALQILRELQFEVESFYRHTFPSDEVIGLRNGVQTALAVTHAAYRNRKSLGTHYRVS